jgi:hypothetical protein
VAQIDIVAQFDDYACESRKLTFEDVARRTLGPKPFPSKPNGRKFRIESKKSFDPERLPWRIEFDARMRVLPNQSMLVAAQSQIHCSSRFGMELASVMSIGGGNGFGSESISSIN